MCEQGFTAVSIAGEAQSSSLPEMLQRQSVVVGSSHGSIVRTLTEATRIPTQMPDSIPSPGSNFSSSVAALPLRNDLPPGLDAGRAAATL